MKREQKSLSTIADFLRDPECLRPPRGEDRNFLSLGQGLSSFSCIIGWRTLCGLRLSSDTEFECHNVSTQTSKEDFLALIEKDPGVG